MLVFIVGCKQYFRECTINIFGRTLIKSPFPYLPITQEAAVPYNVFSDAGMEVDIVSILGGAVPHEDTPKTPGVKRFLNSTTAMAKLNNSSKIDDVDFAEYDVVFMAGGWGAAFDLVCKESTCINTFLCTS